MDLWKNLDKITTQLKKSPTKVLMLDFDGTLTPIVKSPEAVKLSIEMKNLLRKLSQKQGFYVAIISGRSLKDLKKKVSLSNIIYSGNHGLEGEIFGEKYLFTVPDKALRALGEIQEQLNQVTGRLKGTFIQNKSLTLSFHYRLAEEQQVPEIKLLINRILKPYIMGGLVVVIKGKKIIDITPNVKWSKGHFAALIVQKITNRIKTPPMAIVIGDDTTDEDVFRGLKNEITVKVGKGEQSKAKYWLENTDDVFKFLEWMNA